MDQKIVHVIQGDDINHFRSFFGRFRPLDPDLRGPELRIGDHSQTMDGGGEKDLRGPNKTL